MAIVVTIFALFRVNEANEIAAKRLAEIRQERDKKEKALERETHARKAADAATDRARRSAYAADINLAGESLRQSRDVARALELLNLHRPRGGGTDIRGWEWRYLWQLCQPDFEEVVAQCNGTLRSVNVSPNGDYFAITVDHGGVELWDCKTHKLVSAQRRQSQPRFLSPVFSPDGKLIVFVRENGDVELLDVPNLSRRSVPLTTGEGFVASVAFSPDGSQLAALCESNLIVWDLTSSNRIGEVPCRQPSPFVGDVEFSTDGKRLWFGDMLSPAFH